MSQLQVTGEAKIRDIQGPVVANDGVITALDGAASQYVRGDGTLADFPTSSGGGSSVSYYLNSSVSQGTIGGVAYRELSKEPIIGAGTDIAISSNGYVASYLTDANDPDVILIPGGNFNCEFYFSVNNNTGNPFFYAELYKYDGTTFTLLGSSVGVPESISQGTTIAPYYFAIPVATATLALTDRLAIRIYVNVGGRTVTLHTENGHLCQVVTTLSKGMVSLNNLTDQSQFLTTGTSGTDFNIVSSGDTHTFNIPSASASNRGLITTGSQTIAGSKTFSSAISGDAGVLLKNGFITYSNGYTSLGGDIGNLIISSSISGTPYDNEFSFTPSTSNTYTFPNASGTIALTSNLSAYVPYTGATANVDLGAFSLTASSVGAAGFFALGSGTVSGYIALKQGTTLLGNVTGYNSINSNATRFIFISDIGSSNFKSASFQLGSLTNNTERTYTFPDLSGTLALLEGTQTFTGAKTFDEGISLKSAAFPTPATGYSSIGGNSFGITIITKQSSTIYTSNLGFPAANRTFTFPNADGTMALLEGTQTFSGLKTFANDVIIDSGISGNPLSFKQYGSSATGASGYTSLYAIGSTTLGINFGASNSILLSSLSLTANRIYTFPDASGTLALTSDIPSITGLVPYTGATANLNLGTFDLTADVITGATGSFSSSGGSNTFAINHSSGSGIALTITKGGNGEGLIINKTSGSGNALSVTGSTSLGALSGTSATFSGNMGIGGISSADIIGYGTNGILGILGAAGNPASIQLGVVGTAAATTTLLGDVNVFGLNGGSSVVARTIIRSALDGATNSTKMDFFTMNSGALASRLTIAATGAATFSSSVTATTGNFAQTSANSRILVTANGVANTVLGFNNSGSTVNGVQNNAGYVGILQSYPLIFTIADSERMRIAANGNTSIGGDLSLTPTNSALIFSSGFARIFMGTTEAMRITSGGNVGIGTSSPDGRLTIKQANSLDYRGLLVIDSATPNWIGLAHTGSAGVISVGYDGAGAYYPMLFKTSDTERIRIASGGAVTIQVPTSGQALTIYGRNNNWTQEITGSSTTGQSYGLTISAGTNSTDSSLYVLNQAGNAVYFRVRGDGLIQTGTSAASPYNNTSGAAANMVVTSGGTLERSTSSLKYKTDVKDYTKGLNEVLQLRPVFYKGKGKNDGDKQYAGLIAEEVHELGLTEFVQYAEDGTPDALAYQNMIALAFKAIQEQQAQIEELNELIKNK